MRVLIDGKSEEPPLYRKRCLAGFHDICLPAPVTLASDTVPDSPVSTVCQSAVRGTLRCILQRNRPEHVSRRPDNLPFENANTLRRVFAKLDLPTSYLQVSDGLPCVTHSQIVHSHRGQAIRYEFIAHCTTKEGNWSMALSHDAKAAYTSVFWSVDDRVNSDALLDDLGMFRKYAHHPMLLPCVMFASNLRAAVGRRNTIKEKLVSLEQTILSINTNVVQTSEAQSRLAQKCPDGSEGIENLFNLLHNCRRQQDSREGRYEFWRSFHAAILDGFEYTEHALSCTPAQDLHNAHSELRQWTSITWQKLESLKARDKDYINRANDASDMVRMNHTPTPPEAPLTTILAVQSHTPA